MKKTKIKTKTKTKTKIRLDCLLTEKGLVQSRAKAQALIMSGKVLVNNEKMTKAGTQVQSDVKILIIKPKHNFVSRGGLKLEKALNEFGIDVKDKVILDVGASTGGFTDCLLQRGAGFVHSLDVGYGQLHWKLRQDKRVNVLERTNIRHIDENDLEPKPEMVVIDVSFISLTKVVPVLFGILPSKSDIVALIKPQFEVGKGKVGKGGVVRDLDLRKQAVDGIVNFLVENSCTVQPPIESPITGPKGNVEYLVFFQTP
jgi:23S rRNA (cytidine1920-2'-O)/16S rRNA (cytidine1409-2'-O)-methyltransferase